MKVEIKMFTLRQRLAIWIGLWMINILEPWEYSHQQKEYIEPIKALLKEKE